MLVKKHCQLGYNNKVLAVEKDWECVGLNFVKHDTWMDGEHTKKPGVQC